MIKKILNILLFVVAIVVIYFLSEKYFFRLDLTAEKRYSVSDNTKKLLRNMDTELTFTIYLDGDLNSGFLRLKKATREMIEEFNAYARPKINFEFINPSEASTQEEREKKYEELAEEGITGTLVHDRDKEGKSVQKVVFPWIKISYRDNSGQRDTLLTRNVNLLKKLPGKSGEENLNISIQNLEYELTDEIRLITTKNRPKVAFIEGHGEWQEIFTINIEEALFRYYDIYRGVIDNDPASLNPYDAIIIASPQEPFSEKDKYIIDQYIMQGGKVLWLIDAVKISLDSLARQASTVGLINDINLGDQLFRYGVRINPVLVQDAQSALVPVNVAPEGEPAQFEPAPWYYSPLLLTAPLHPITKNLSPVKADFAGSIDFVGEDLNVKKDILLVTSTGTHVQNMPAVVSMDVINIEKNGAYFDKWNIMVGAALEGIFPSVFTNRLVPEGIKTNQRTITESKPTKMIVVADGDIIRNDVLGHGSNTQIVPLGYDRYMNQQFGNKDFILNAVNFLTDDEGWMDLRSREIKLRLLNQPAVIGLRKFWQLTNVLLPLILLGVFGLIFYFIRKKRYS
jgi:gliding-associated putative ABC transporter substrate-binding component GldG